MNRIRFNELNLFAQELYRTICLKTVEAGDLCLRDLGYFDLGDLQAIHDKKAYYI